MPRTFIKAIQNGNEYDYKDTYLREHAQLVDERTSAITSASTDNEYPTAKAVYDAVTTSPVPYSILTKIAPLLHTITYDTIDYEYANEYFRSEAPAEEGFCSAIRQGDYFGRNLDWHAPLENIEDTEPDFIVTTPNKVVGISSVPNLTEKMAQEHQSTELWKIVPFMLKDGYNGSLFICQNVVPTDKGDNTRTTPTVETREEVCARMLPRYVLDRFTNAEEAINYIKQYVSVYSAKSLKEQHYDLHWMIGDSGHTYVMEIVNNQIVWQEHNIMTNFHINGVDFLPNGKVYTNADAADGNLPTSLGITPYAAGLERYNKLVDGASDMRTLMNSILYSNAYNLEESPFWYSEYTTQEYNVTVDTLPTNTTMQAIIEAAQEIKRKEREGMLWCTTHSVIYNLKNGSMNIVSFEDVDNVIEYNKPAEGEKYYAGTNINIDGNNVISVTGITVPTKVSELENDEGYLTEHQPMKTINNQPITGTGNIQIEGALYTGGANIDIDSNNVISVTGITVPTKVSELENDEGYITGYTETDPVFQASPAATITNVDKTNWNNKAETSDIPTKVSDLDNDSGFLTQHQPIKTINNQVITGTGNVNIETSSVIEMTQAEYEALDPSQIDPSKLYILTDANVPYEFVSARTSVVNSTSTNNQYPTAKAVYDAIEAIPHTEYSAGTNIDITNNVISVTGINLSTKADASALTEHTSDSVIHVTNADKTNWNSKPDVEDIPTKVSELENDEGYLTEHQPLKTINYQVITGTGNIDIQGGSASVVELTQAQYDALPVKDPTVIYAITDAEPPFEYISARTSAVTSTSTSNEYPTAKAVYDYVEGSGFLTEHQPMKTINNQVITGTGNIDIQGGSASIEEMTEAEYDEITPDPTKLYVLTDTTETPIHSDVSQAGAGTAINNIVTITKAAFNALTIKDNRTIYLVQE